jgi:hypothetical protein
MKDAMKRLEESGKERDAILERIEERLTGMEERLIEGNGKFDAIEYRLEEIERG